MDIIIEMFKIINFTDIYKIISDTLIVFLCLMPYYIGLIIFLIIIKIFKNGINI